MDGKILEKEEPSTTCFPENRQVSNWLFQPICGEGAVRFVFPHMRSTRCAARAMTLTNNVPISHTGEFKAACLSGVVPADGLLFSGHGNCEGCAEWLGYQTFRSAEGISLHAATSAADRLLAGKAVNKPVVAATPRDWTTYRANNSRSGSSLATVSAAAKLAWTWTPNPPFDYLAELQSGLETQSTQPVCVGDRVFFGTAAGIVRCLDRKTGEELWNYPTAGRIISAPTFWEGRLYVGSGDGRVYCLDVRDGSLVWRYRVARLNGGSWFTAT